MDWTPEIPFENLEMDWEDEAFLDEDFPEVLEEEEEETEVAQFTSTGSNFTYEVDNLMDNSIEIESNKRMKAEHMHPITLTFKDPDTEEMYHQVRADLLKSNVVCTLIIWVLIVICQSIVAQECFRFLLAPFIPATLLLVIGLLLVMAEEFPQLPLNLRRLSTRLARATFGRKAFICALMAIISVPSMLTLILINGQCKVNPESYLGQGLPQASSPTLSSPPQPSRETISASKKDNNGFKTQLSSAHEPRFGTFQSRNLYRTTYDTPKSRAGVYNVEHRIYLDYIDEDSIHKLENKQSYAENSTLPFAPEYKQKRSVNISIENRKLTVDSQKTLYVEKAVGKEKYPVSGKNFYYSKRAKCKTIKPLVKVANPLGGEARTRVRRSDEKLGHYVNNIENKLVTENNDIFQVNKQITCNSGTDELPVARIYPQYFIYTWVLCMVALASFLKLNYLVKTIVLVFMVTCYGILIVNFSNEISHCYSGFSLTARLAVLLVLFFFMVSYHGRLVEITSRLDFVWKQQALRELTDMNECRLYNTQLLKNILPDHVATYFLSDDRRGEELFSKAYENVGVLFASIPNFTQFYSEDVNRGMECIRLLNEIIADFDELLDEKRFACIEKIKTIGSTYMAASGLNPTEKDAEDSHAHLCALVDFALEMKARLEDVNKHSFNNFRLRVGVSHGPLVGGVIGAKKPVFDVWGNTVNEASRMDSTGANDTIQIPKETAQTFSLYHPAKTFSLYHPAKTFSLYHPAKTFSLYHPAKTFSLYHPAKTFSLYHPAKTFSLYHPAKTFMILYLYNNGHIVVLYLYNNGHIVILYLYNNGHIVILYLYNNGHIVILYLYNNGHIVVLYLYNNGHIVILYLYNNGHIVILYLYNNGHIVILYLYNNGHIVILYLYNKGHIVILYLYNNGHIVILYLYNNGHIVILSCITMAI
ncbi:Adenylate cyclase type 8 [Chionoecetes opilio]|uniref:adenylate cyclase n=1 Tax=Chionoecetes opilio TaxID=41210 RepID=A0A8J4XM83_CHIOP|nr:Adenylate cyclase type 8 [Chionoecetes opilio]